MDDFHALLDEVHRRGMRMVLDGVFNHCGRGFFAFADILENQDASPYLKWFHIHHFPVDAYSLGDATDYLGWWGMKSLPKFNTHTPAVRQYILDVARYWIEQGIDGWRLDVPNEIDDDSFWAEFRYTVKSANPEAYLLGEIWTADKRWVERAFRQRMNCHVRDAFCACCLPGRWISRNSSRRSRAYLRCTHAKTCMPCTYRLARTIPSGC
jgi:glycosidase